MIQSIFRNGFSSDVIIQYILIIPIVLISLSLHEFSHGYAAYLCGDHTAKNYGRLTMNPIKHLDPIGAIMMLIFGFGWAKPVPINTRNFKKFKRDLALVAIAGPLSNIALAIVSVLLLFLSGKLFGLGLVYDSGFLFYSAEPSKLAMVVSTFLYTSAALNIGLAVFNLIPLPPLDGSRIITSILPRRLLNGYLQIEQYSRYIFLGIILSSYVPLRIFGFSSLADLIFFPIDWLRSGILNAILKLFSFIF